MTYQLMRYATLEAKKLSLKITLFLSMKMIKLYEMFPAFTIRVELMMSPRLLNIGLKYVKPNFRSYLSF